MSPVAPDPKVSGSLHARATTKNRRNCLGRQARRSGSGVRGARVGLKDRVWRQPDGVRRPQAHGMGSWTWKGVAAGTPARRASHRPGSTPTAGRRASCCKRAERAGCETVLDTCDSLDTGLSVRHRTSRRSGRWGPTTLNVVRSTLALTATGPDKFTPWVNLFRQGDCCMAILVAGHPAGPHRGTCSNRLVGKMRFAAASAWVRD